LYERNIKLESVAACSMGTLISALICSGKSPEEIEKAILDFDFKELRKKKYPWFLEFVPFLKYPFATHKTPDYPRIITDLIGADITLGEMKIPFSAAALDLRQKRFLVYSSKTHPEMKISEVIRIATAIPGMYEPYKLEKRLLVDAAVATESPVWIAANNNDSLPILVLKTRPSPTENYRKGFISYISNVVFASTASHDYFLQSQTPRSIEVSINSEEMNYANFDITREQIEKLILQGQEAMETKLKEMNYDLSSMLDVEEVAAPVVNDSQANRAETLATQMISTFKNEGMKRNQVFISYSRNDRPWLEKFKTHLKSIERFTGIKAWDDTAIQPGQEWSEEIGRALKATKVAVFLVSADFLASQFIQEQEMKYFLEISKRENVPILWVAISDTLYEVTPLQHIQCANEPKRPLDKLSSGDQATEWKAICQKILVAMDLAKAEVAPALS
jgi:predicted acylesterase/phospholipase RssA